MSLDLKFATRLKTDASEAPGDLEYRIERAVRAEAHAIFPGAEVEVAVSVAEHASDE